MSKVFIFLLSVIGLFANPAMANCELPYAVVDVAECFSKSKLGKQKNAELYDIYIDYEHKMKSLKEELDDLTDQYERRDELHPTVAESVLKQIKDKQNDMRVLSEEISAKSQKFQSAALAIFEKSMQDAITNMRKLGVISDDSIIFKSDSLISFKDGTDRTGSVINEMDNQFDGDLGDSNQDGQGGQSDQEEDGDQSDVDNKDEQQRCRDGNEKSKKSKK